MSKQLTLSSMIAVFAMVALVAINSAHPVSSEAGAGIAALQAELPQVDEDALSLLSPWFVSN
ncbi:MAG: hypothetical protein ABJ239_07520 [Erythrobacter sp.]